jgi:hypothetical protein
MSATARGPAFPGTIQDGAFDLIDLVSEAAFLERCLQAGAPRVSVAKAPPRFRLPLASAARCRCDCAWCSGRAPAWSLHRVASLPAEARF